MPTVKGEVTAPRRPALGLASAFVFSSMIFSQAAAGPAPGGTPGGAVPKDSPWAFTQDQPVSIDIPRVSERPLSAEAGPRVTVDAFVLDVDTKLLPVLPVALRSQMETLVEQRRVAQPGSSFTIGQMEQVANALTDLLRDNDFIVAYAFLPTQQVSAGRVQINVLSGTLGEVSVEGNRVLSTNRIRLPFNHLVGQPLQRKSLEAAILSLRDYPGLAPSAVLSPGDEVGTTNLTVRVLERRASAQVMVDNYGSEQTGEGRARLRLDWNSPFGIGDRLTVNVLQTFSPSDGTFGGAIYEVPIGRGFSMGALYDLNTFDVRDPIEFDGDSETIALFARQSLKRSRELNMDLRAELAKKEATYDIPGQEPEDSLAVLSLFFDAEGVDRIGNLGVNSFSVGYHHGFPDFLDSMDEDGINDNGRISTRVGASGDRAGGEFDKFTLQYQRLQSINPANAFVFRVFGQYSDDLLTSLEQMTMGGAYNVRAYSTAEYLADSGVFGSLEYTLNIASLLETRPDDWDVNLSLFYDHAWGEKNDPLTSEVDDLELGGPGAGVHFEYRWGNGNGIMLRAEVAVPTTNREPLNDRDPQYWLRFEYFRR